MDDPTGLFIVISLVVLAVCSVAGYLMLARVGRGADGWALGFFLGPLGLVLAWVIRDNALRDDADGIPSRTRPVQRRPGGVPDITSIVVIAGTIFAVFGFLIYRAG